MTIWKKHRAKCLILRRSTHLLLHRKMREKMITLRLSHLHWMPLLMKEDEPLDPMDVGLFGSACCNGAPAWRRGPGQSVSVFDSRAYEREK
jgi:hypothetical protein